MLAAATAYGLRKPALRDIGTYLIAWCRDFADRYPETEIIGIAFLMVEPQSASADHLLQGLIFLQSNLISRLPISSLR